MNNTYTASVTDKQAFDVVNSEFASNHGNSLELSNQQYSQAILSNIDPSNIQVEENIIGGLLLDPEAMPRVVNVLEPQHFYVVSHKLIYKRIQELYEQEGVTDILSLKSYLEEKKELNKIGGMGKLSQLLDHTISAINIDKYVQLIVFKWSQREAMAISRELYNFSQNHHPEFYNNYGSQENGKPCKLSAKTSQFLSDFEEKVLAFTRSKYRGDLSRDGEVRTADSIINQIKDINSTISDLHYKRYKLMNLAKKYKMSEKQLENLYLSYLLNSQNQPIQTLAELRKKYGDNVNEWFVQGMIPKGSTILLHSLGGVGKTRLVYDLIFAMVTGTSWGNQFPVTAATRRCLLVQTDESPNDMLRSLNSRGFTDEMPIFVKTNWSLDHLADLKREIIENNIDVVFIDSLTSVNKNAIVSENDTEYARPILELRDLAQELNISIIISHHSNSEGKSRGTKAIHNSVSQVLCLKLPSEQSKSSCPNRLLIFEKSRLRRPTEYKLAFNMDEETYQWSWVCEGENRQPSETDSITDIILKFLAENRNQLFSAEEIAKLCKLALNTVRKVLFKLSELDKIVGRKRSKKKGTPWLHFLRWEMESSPPEESEPETQETEVQTNKPIEEETIVQSSTLEPKAVETILEEKEDLPDLPDPQNLPDLPDLKGGDQGEVAQDKDCTFPDPTSVKVEKALKEIEQRNRRSGIRENNVTSETVVKSTIEPDVLPDPLPEMLPDPQKKEHKEGSGKRLGEISVRYVGTDPELAKLCALSKNIKLLGRINSNGMCFIWSENWSQPTQVFWNDLAESETT